MISYKGVHCPVCNREFDASDDIVVCPVCGAPHHRTCYAERGNCVYADEHAGGFEWQPPVIQDSTVSADIIMCPECGNPNPGEGTYCQICGHKLAQDQTKREQNGSAAKSGSQVFGEWAFPGEQVKFDPEAFAYGGVKPDDSIFGVPVPEMAAYIGANASYFLPRFKVMDKLKTVASPNFSALFFNFLYFFYRKMYLAGTILFVIFALSMIPSFLYAKAVMPDVLRNAGLTDMLMQAGFQITVEADYVAAAVYERMSGIVRLLHFIFCVIVAIFSNRIYLTKVLRSIRRIQAEMKGQPDQSLYRSVLIRKGGFSQASAILAGAAAVAAYFAGSMAILYSITSVL